MNILFASFEASPFYKKGGLGDVAGSLPIAFEKLDIHTTLILPGYSFLNLPSKPKELQTIDVFFNGKIEKVLIKRLHYREKITLDIIYHPFLSEIRKKENKILQYVFFSLAISSIVNNVYPKKYIEVIHLNDWHTSFVAYTEAHRSKIPTLLTIHNLAYQGKIERGLLEKAVGESIEGSDCRSLLQLGIDWSSYISTVSPTYAHEIVNTSLGKNLRNDLVKRKSKVVGIVNGIDEAVWNPKTDAKITKNYTIKTLIKGKEENKVRLQKMLKMTVDPMRPLVSFIGRIEPNQKGIDLIIQAIRYISKLEFQLVILGTGDMKLTREISNLVSDKGKNICFINKFDDSLSHKIYASSHFILIPSKYEPCGLVQMIAMRYGTLPLVRKTGGLADTVKHNINGFVFENYSATELSRTLRLALKMFKDNPEKIKKMQETAMKEDFSWDKSAKEYKKLYSRLISHR